MSDDTKSTRRGFGYLALIGAALVGLVGGGFASSAFGHGGFGMRHWGGGPGGWGHHGGGRGGHH